MAGLQGVVSVFLDGMMYPDST
ncbi:hypothetical protein A2U01_0031588, partial [Trifolium medium]|nr:hypothetical protein [Trifolium medium]